MMARWARLHALEEQISGPAAAAVRVIALYNLDRTTPVVAQDLHDAGDSFFSYDESLGAAMIPNRRWPPLITRSASMLPHSAWCRQLTMWCCLLGCSSCTAGPDAAQSQLLDRFIGRSRGGDQCGCFVARKGVHRLIDVAFVLQEKNQRMHTAVRCASNSGSNSG